MLNYFFAFPLRFFSIALMLVRRYDSNASVSNSEADDDDNNDDSENEGRKKKVEKKAKKPAKEKKERKPRKEVNYKYGMKNRTETQKKVVFRSIPNCFLRPNSI